MLDWLLGRQRWIETSLANRHLADATLILHERQRRGKPLGERRESSSRTD